MKRSVQRGGPYKNQSSPVVAKCNKEYAMHIIQAADLLPLADLENQQLWMVHDLTDSINAEIERNRLSIRQTAEVLERLAGILRRKSNG
jgi:hypothetical protein